MKLLMTANLNEKHKRYNSKQIRVLLKAQIENSIEVGWKAEDIILISNFDFEFMEVISINAELNDFCMTGSKLFAVKWYIETYRPNYTIWSKDLDIWQNCWFDCPEFDGDVGASQYSNPKYNGGSVFWKPEAKDILDEVIRRISENKENKEEPMLNRVFRKDKKYNKRVSKLDYTYNVGCSGFAPRLERSLKPIRGCHFHPNNGVAWEIHALDRDRIGEIAVTIRLERLLRKYYPNLATELKPKKDKGVI